MSAQYTSELITRFIVLNYYSRSVEEEQYAIILEGRKSDAPFESKLLYLDFAHRLFGRMFAILWYLAIIFGFLIRGYEDIARVIVIIHIFFIPACVSYGIADQFNRVRKKFRKTGTTVFTTKNFVIGAGLGTLVALFDLLGLIIVEFIFSLPLFQIT